MNDSRQFNLSGRRGACARPRPRTSNSGFLNRAKHTARTQCRTACGSRARRRTCAARESRALLYYFSVFVIKQTLHVLALSVKIGFLCSVFAVAIQAILSKFCL